MPRNLRRCFGAYYFFDFGDGIFGRIGGFASRGNDYLRKPYGTCGCSTLANPALTVPNISVKPVINSSLLKPSADGEQSMTLLRVVERLSAIVMVLPLFVVAMILA